MKIKVNQIQRNELQFQVQTKYRTLIQKDKTKFDRNRSKRETLKEVKNYN